MDFNLWILIYGLDIIKYNKIILELRIVPYLKLSYNESLSSNK